MTELKTGTVRVNNINFHYLELGDGPLVICIHGFPDHAYTFRHMLPALAESGFRAIAPFTRGYAPTEAPKDGYYQTALLSQDILGLMDALGADQAALVGHDWGALAASGASILEPDRVPRLVILASAHRGAAEITNFHYLKGIWHVYYFQSSNATDAVSHNDYAFLEDWWHDASPEWNIPNDVLEDVKNTFRKPGVVDAALNYYRHNYNPDLRDPALEIVQSQVDTAFITVPTLAMHGTSDRPRRLEAFQRMAPFFVGRLDRIVVPGTGHFLHLEKPREVNTRIVEFLNS